MKLRGKVWIFEGILDVDWEICAYDVARQVRDRYVLGELTTEDITREFSKHCMTKLDPDFPKKVKSGDFIIGGEGMGYGHDHDHACLSIKGAGVGAVLCEATNANFKRNCIHHGLPVVELKGIMSAVKQGDELEVDLVKGVVKNLNSGQELKFQPYPDFLIEIFQAGGVYPLLKFRIAAGKL